MKGENNYELVVGDKSRSGGQWDIWEATYSPVGADGYPMRIWNKETGAIDHAVAEQWRKYDLLDVIKTTWATLGPKIGHKLNVYVGDMDSYYLNDAVENLNAFWQKAGDPKEMGEIVFQRRAPHCWGPRGASGAGTEAEPAQGIHAGAADHAAQTRRRHPGCDTGQAARPSRPGQCGLLAHRDLRARRSRPHA